MIQCAKRIARPNRAPKEPITPETLQKMYRVIGGDNACLLDLRKFCILLISYVGFLRFDEVSNLIKGDATFFNTHMSVFIEKSKTDIYRDGNTLAISRLNSALCPVKMLAKYIETAKIANDDEFLFRAVTWWGSKSRYTLKAANKPISYTTAREDALDLVRRVGLDNKDFGLHSARSGGATSAANNGVPDRLFKRHGRWKSEKAKDSYIKDNLSQLLSVSRNLGL